MYIRNPEMLATIIVNKHQMVYLTKLGFVSCSNIGNDWYFVKTGEIEEAIKNLPWYLKLL